MTWSASRLPSLGPRGEGWVIGQFVLIALVGALGLRDRPRRPIGRALAAPLTLAGLASISVGAFVAVRGAQDLGANLTPMPRPLPDAELVETGMYRRIRHPLYAAVLLLTAGWAAVTQSVRALVAAGVLAVWLDTKARREEAWLMSRFSAYAAYRRRTSRFVPGLY